MKKLSLFVILSFLAISSSFGQFKFGAGLETNFNAFGVAGKANLQVNDEWAGQVGFTYFLSSGNPSRLDLDTHYTITTAGDYDQIILKGVGGFNYWSSGVPGAGGELGLNIGAHISFPVDSYSFYIEPKITIISVGDFFVGACIYF
jgi:hypothetical protein